MFESGHILAVREWIQLEILSHITNSADQGYHSLRSKIIVDEQRKCDMIYHAKIKANTKKIQQPRDITAPPHQTL